MNISAHTPSRRFVVVSLAALLALANNPKCTAEESGTAPKGRPGNPSGGWGIVIDCTKDADVAVILKDGREFALREGEAVSLIDRDIILFDGSDAPIVKTHFLYGGDYEVIGGFPV